MSIISKIITFFKHPRKYLVTVILGLALIIVVFRGGHSKLKVDHIDYSQHLDETAVTLEEKDISLRDLAYYVAYEEDKIQDQAKVYDADDPTKYWKIHTNGKFVVDVASDAMIKMALHDEIFYEMAMAENISLTGSEKTRLANSQNDFWLDLTDYDKQEYLGVAEEDIFTSMEKAAVAEKYQALYENTEGYDQGYMDFDADGFAILLEEYTYEINEEIWDKINFGYVTVNR